MNILLVSANVASTPYCVYPLGASMVAAALRREGHRVTLFDLLRRDQSMDAVREEVRRVAPDLVGVSIRNVDNVNLLNEHRYIDVVAEMVRAIRAETAAKIVLGGSGFSVMPGPVLRAVGADYGIVGEGERAFAAFVREAEAGRYPPAPIVRAPGDLSGAGIPAADYDDDLMAFYLRQGNIAPVQTKRGCAHACAYCTYPVLEGRAVRAREPEAVADDVERLVDMGARYIFFTDSVFNDETGQYRALIRTFRDRGLQVPWTAFFKPSDEMDGAIIDAMRETGLRAAEIGSDAPSDATLRGIGKGFTFEDVDRCNALFLDRGVSTAHYFMFGCPGETPETVREGVANLLRLKRTAIFVFLGVRILPHTGIERIAVREGLIREGQDLLDPVYYLSPRVDRAWMEETLKAAFAGHRHIVYPPDALDAQLHALLRMGYTGALSDLLIKPAAGRRRGRGGN